MKAPGLVITSLFLRKAVYGLRRYVQMFAEDNWDFTFSRVKGNVFITELTSES
jgi:hypothetical protein